MLSIACPSSTSSAQVPRGLWRRARAFHDSRVDSPQRTGDRGFRRMLKFNGRARRKEIDVGCSLFWRNASICRNEKETRQSRWTSLCIDGKYLKPLQGFRWNTVIKGKRIFYNKMIVRLYPLIATGDQNQ